MARRASGEQKKTKTKTKTNERRASVAKVGGTVGPRRANQPESSSVGPTNRRSSAHVDGHNPLHQQIAVRAYLLYEQSGFQNGHEVEHWLEAERQVKGEQAA
jgi:hypothetical protein